MSKQAYIACGMTGIHLSNWPHFEAWERKLTDAGWRIVSPTRIDEATGMVHVDRDDEGNVLHVRTAPKFDYEKILAIDFLAVEACDAVILLPGWETSSGAAREKAHAEAHNLEVLTAEEALTWLR